MFITAPSSNVIRSYEGTDCLPSEGRSVPSTEARHPPVGDSSAASGDQSQLNRSTIPSSHADEKSSGDQNQPNGKRSTPSSRADERSTGDRTKPGESRTMPSSPADESSTGDQLGESRTMPSSPADERQNETKNQASQRSLPSTQSTNIPDDDETQTDNDAPYQVYM